MQEAVETFTFLLTPEEAEIIAFAESKGKLLITIRSYNDDSITKRKNVKFSTLLKGSDNNKPSRKKGGIMARNANETRIRNDVARWIMHLPKAKRKPPML